MLTTTTDAPVSYFRALYRVARAVNSSLDVMQMLPIIVSSTTEALGVKACSLRLLSPAGQRLFVAAACGLSPNYRAKGPVDVLYSEVDRIALAAERPVYIADAGCDPRFQYPEQAHEEGIVSVLVAPLRVQNRSVGVMRVYTDSPRKFQEEELDLLEAMASLSALAIENARLYERLQRDYQAALEFTDRSFDD